MKILKKHEQALTLSCCTQWPVGPVDFKSYWPPKKVTGPNFFIKKNTFLRYITFQVKDASLVMISFIPLVIYFYAFSQYSA